MNTDALRVRTYQDAASKLSKSTRAIFLSLAAMPGIQGELARVAAETGSQRKPDEQVRHDAQTLALAARQVEHVMAGLYEEPFPQYPMAEGQIIDIDTSVPIGAKVFTWYGVTGRAIAEFVASWAGGSAPLASLGGISKSQPIHAAANGYAHSLDDMRTAAFAGFPLDQQFGRVVREGHAELHHRVGLWGREDLKLPGLVKHPGITVLDAPADGTASSRYWSAKTSDLILRDVDLLVTNVSEVSYGRRQTTDVRIPRREWNQISAMRIGTVDTVTVMDFLRKIYPGITWGILDDLAASQSGGNLSADAALAYVKDPNIVQLVIPMAFLQHPPQQVDLMIKVPCESKIGGVTLKEPPTVVRLDSIGST